MTTLSPDQDTNHLNRMITIILADATISIKSALLENNLFFHFVMDGIDLEKAKVTLNLTISDFFPILNYLQNKKIVRGMVTDFPAFFNACEYIGENMLPSLVSTDSKFIQRFAMSIDDIMINDTEELLHKLYLWMDTHIYDNKDIHTSMLETYRQQCLMEYKKDIYNNKLNEKSGGKLFPCMEKTSIHSLIRPLISIISKKKHHYEATIEPELLVTKRSEITIQRSKNLTQRSHGNPWKIEIHEKFHGFPWKMETGGFFILAGDSILNYIDNHHSKTDYEFFMVTRDEKEAKMMIHMVSRWVEANSEFIYEEEEDEEEGINNEFFIMRTENEIVFVTIQGILCIHLQLYHSAEQVLIGFTMDPCCVGYDGEQFLITPRGEHCLATHQFPIVSWRSHEPYLTTRYHHQFYIAFPGLTLVEMNNIDEKRYLFHALSNQHRSHYTVLEKMVLLDDIITGDYEMVKYQIVYYSQEHFSRYEYRPSRIVVFRQLINDFILEGFSIVISDDIETMFLPDESTDFIKLTNLSFALTTPNRVDQTDDWFNTIKW